jgi:flagellar hook protein FlgE
MSASNVLHIGAGGLRSFAVALSTVSDNIANSGSTAFKASGVEFGDLVQGYYNTNSKDSDRMGLGSAVLGVHTNFNQGSLEDTGSWSDLAINGDGFFSVQDATTNTVYYTRDGSFLIDKTTGNLTTALGYNVLDSAGAVVNIEPDPATPTHNNFYVDGTGKIWGSNLTTGVVEQIGTTPVGVTTFMNDTLIRQGNNMYLPGAESTPPNTGPPTEDGRGAILDFKLEGSNVDLASEMVNMIIYQADYNANSKSVSTGNGMLETVINMVRS